MLKETVPGLGGGKYYFDGNGYEDRMVDTENGKWYYFKPGWGI